MLRKGIEIIPGYRLVSFLGRGAFGEVWKSTAPGNGFCAIKILNIKNKHGWKEFLALKRIIRFRHPNLNPIVSLWVLDADYNILTDEEVESTCGANTPASNETLVPSAEWEVRAHWLIAIQTLGDKTLSDRLQECKSEGLRGIPTTELMAYMSEAALAIDFLNGASTTNSIRPSILHCDIKPSNILITGDSAQLCDYGLSRVVVGDAFSVTTTSMVGSAAYISPECISRSPSRTSDQYSFALTYVELRTGRLPFSSTALMDVLEAHRNNHLLLDDIPKPERAVVQRATHLNPLKRFSCCTAFVNGLCASVGRDGHEITGFRFRQHELPTKFTKLARFFAQFLRRTTVNRETKRAKPMRRETDRSRATMDNHLRRINALEESLCVEIEKLRENSHLLREAVKYVRDSAVAIGQSVRNMTLTVHCPSCGTRIRINRNHLGRKIRCTKCNGLFRLQRCSCGTAR